LPAPRIVVNGKRLDLGGRLGSKKKTEIIATPGIVLTGPLPEGCELKTMYTAAVTTHAANASLAQALIDLLTSTDAQAARSQAGFSTG